jgi:hypothetical protein
MMIGGAICFVMAAEYDCEVEGCLIDVMLCSLPRLQ